MNMEETAVLAFGAATAVALAYLIYAPRWRKDRTPTITRRNYLIGVVSVFWSGFILGVWLFD